MFKNTNGRSDRPVASSKLIRRGVVQPAALAPPLAADSAGFSECYRHFVIGRLGGAVIGSLCLFQQFMLELVTDPWFAIVEL